MLSAALPPAVSTSVPTLLHIELSEATAPSLLWSGSRSEFETPYSGDIHAGPAFVSCVFSRPGSKYAKDRIVNGDDNVKRSNKARYTAIWRHEESLPVRAPEAQ